MHKINELFSGVDSVLLSTHEGDIDPNFYYFSQLSRATELSSFLILRKNKKPLLLTTLLEYEGLKKNRNLNILLYRTEKELSRILRKHLVGKTGINYARCTLSGFQKLKKFFPSKKFVDISDKLSGIRGIKTRSEINKISEACRIAEEALEMVPVTAKAGMAEKDLAEELEHFAKTIGAESLSFPAIVAVGKNASVPHHISGTTKITRGKMLLVDFGVIYGGYCSDLTRTFFIGRAGEDATGAYTSVYRAQRMAIKSIRGGASSSDIFATANDVIAGSLGQELIHSLGHGIGIEIHEAPRISEKDTFILRENMCITVEPAYYGKKFGIRLEDDVVVQKNGCKLLSNAPKDLIEI